jgi:hypothetical protein
MSALTSEPLSAVSLFHHLEIRFREFLLSEAFEQLVFGVWNLDMLVSQCLDKRPYKGGFVSGCMANENVVEHS